MNTVITDTYRFKVDRFGSMLWTPKGKVFKFPWDYTRVLYLTTQVRSIVDLKNKLPDLSAQIDDLVKKGFLSPTPKAECPVSLDDLEAVHYAERFYRNKKVCKPLWVHIQPFTFCNQACIHCYCNGSPRIKKGFPVGLAAWKKVVDALIDFGVWDIYLTGGENFIDEQTFDLAEYILDKGAKTAMSTNASVISDAIYDRLARLEMSSIQVSLDGSHPGIHDKIRQVPGAFEKTKRNIDRLTRIKKVGLNTVVNRYNIADIENIVQFGIDRSIRNFSFFPQKNVGRSAKGDLLSEREKQDMIHKCSELSQKYHCNIETFDMSKPCGSGTDGFAITENLDVVPCIFSVHDKAKYCGNLSKEKVENIWYDSPVLNEFRHRDARQPCLRCDNRC